MIGVTGVMSICWCKLRRDELFALPKENLLAVWFSFVGLL